MLVPHVAGLVVIGTKAMMVLDCCAVMHAAFSSDFAKARIGITSLHCIDDNRLHADLQSQEAVEQGIQTNVCRSSEQLLQAAGHCFLLRSRGHNFPASPQHSRVTTYQHVFAELMLVSLRNRLTERISDSVVNDATIQQVKADLNILLCLTERRWCLLHQCHGDQH